MELGGPQNISSCFKLQRDSAAELGKKEKFQWGELQGWSEGSLLTLVQKVLDERENAHLSRFARLDSQP